MKVRSFNADDYKMKNGKLQAYAWPGGYPIFYVTQDNCCLCPDCVNDNLELCLEQDIDERDDQWYIVAADINYEDDTLYCDNCNKQIESAYGDN